MLFFYLDKQMDFRVLCPAGSAVFGSMDRAPIIGCICIDQTHIDMTDIPKVSSGDIAVLILLFFCNLFIGKQKRRTAIERSLGMGKRSCTISLLTGVLAIVTLGSIVGCGAGYALSGAVMGLLSALSKSVSFSTEFSNWAQSTSDVTQMNLVTGMVSPLVPLICFTSVVLLSLGISLLQIRSNLRSEPLKLLSTPKS